MGRLGVHPERGSGGEAPQAENFSILNIKYCKTSNKPPGGLLFQPTSEGLEGGLFNFRGGAYLRFYGIACFFCNSRHENV